MECTRPAFAECVGDKNFASEIAVVKIFSKPIFRKEVNLNKGLNSIPIELENEDFMRVVIGNPHFFYYSHKCNQLIFNSLDCVQL